MVSMRKCCKRRCLDLWRDHHPTESASHICCWHRETEAACMYAVKHWGFVAGFFSFHCLCALFDQDDERLNDAQIHLSTACSKLGLGTDFQELLCCQEGDRLSFFRRCIQKALVESLGRTIGESIRWMVEYGYLSALVFGALVAQTESNAPREVLINLKAISGILPAIITAADNAGLPDNYTEVLFSIKKQLAESKDRSSAVKCRDMLAPPITSLLLMESPDHIFKPGDNHARATFS